MAATFQLEIVTPTAVIDCGQVEYLRAPSEDGLFGVMARHTRSMMTLGIGEVKVTAGGKDTYYATNGGYADIHGNNVQLLVETAEEAGSIDDARAKAAVQRARERLHSESRKDVDQARAESSFARAINRLGVTQRG